MTINYVMERVCFMVLRNCDVIWILNLKCCFFFFFSRNERRMKKQKRKKNWLCVRVLRMSATYSTSHEMRRMYEMIQFNLKKKMCFQFFDIRTKEANWFELKKQHQPEWSRGENFKKETKSRELVSPVGKMMGEVESLMRRRKKLQYSKWI